MVLKLILLLVGSIISFWLSTITGGGASLILIPLLNGLLTPSTAPLALTIGTFSSSASRILVFKQHINWKIFAWFVPFSIPAVIIGAWLMRLANPLYLEIFVALFLLANLPELFKNKKALQQEEQPYPTYILAMVGFIAGFVSGITGAIGLLFNRFYLRYGLTKEQIVATRAANEISLHIIKLAVYVMLGMYSYKAISYGLLVALGAIASSFTIKYILPYISEYLFRKVGYGAMVISGLVLFVNTAKNIQAQDHLYFYTNNYEEAAFHWRESHFVLEFSLGEGLEIERQISPVELPPHIKTKYDSLAHQCERVYVEVVYKLGKARGYELYCHSGSAYKKFEFEE